MKKLEISMWPGEKHKKLLKEEGFECKGNTWRKELADGELYIYMKTGRFCSMGNGSYFHFKIYFRNAEEKTAAVDTRGSLTNFFLPSCVFYRRSVPDTIAALTVIEIICHPICL